MTDPWRWTATRIAEAVRAREVSCREVIESHLARIETTNPSVNAVTRILAGEALAIAESHDRRLAAGERLGPIAGVPITVKENVDLAGSPTTMGVQALAADLPLGDAPHVAQLKAAGAIPIARTNLPDYALRWHTENALHGLTRNPWDANLTCGGSSGGDAAAIATGMTPIGLGNDIAGSVRWPSQCCATCALKPTRGRVPRTRMTATPVPRSMASQVFAVHGPMARSVEDLWLAITNMSGYSPHDPGWVPAPLVGPPEEEPIRVALVTDPDGRGIEPAVEAAVRAAGNALTGAGYTVEEVPPPAFERTIELYWQCLGDLTTASNPDYVSDSFARYRDAFAPFYPEVMGSRSPDPWAERLPIATEWSRWMDEYPLILAPVATCSAFPVGYDEDPANALDWLHAIRWIVAVNFLGLPAVALPTGIAGGIPQGVQVISRSFREDLAIRAAKAIEDAVSTFTPIDP
ncbi:MAG: amidase [Dehalococcoidia bacterium]